MKNFYDQEDYTDEDILSLIKNSVEESPYLEFKESKALVKSDGARKEISKDVAAFANSDGGIIVYGIKEDHHIASDLSYIDGNEFTKEWLEQVINSGIQRHIPDLRIFPIRFDNKIENTIYIVKIPKSLEAPHLSKDKRFYRRFEFESVAMDEYEIRQLYGRTAKSKLLISDYTIYELTIDNENHRQFEFEFSISNVGDIPESSYKLNVYFNNFSKNMTIHWDQSPNNYDYTRYEGGRIKVSAVSLVPIYPDERVTVLRFRLITESFLITEVFSTLTMEIKLLYLNGEDHVDSDFKDYLKEITDPLYVLPG